MYHTPACRSMQDADFYRHKCLELAAEDGAGLGFEVVLLGFKPHLLAEPVLSTSPGGGTVTGSPNFQRMHQGEMSMQELAGAKARGGACPPAPGPARGKFTEFSASFVQSVSEVTWALACHLLHCCIDRPPHPWLDLPPGSCLRTVPLSCIVCRHRRHDLICRIRIFIGFS